MKRIESVEEANEAFGMGSEAALAAARAMDPKPELTWEERLLAQEREAFAKASKIDEKDYEGWVSWSGVRTEERYFESVEDLRVHCKSEGIPVPSFVWACTPEPFVLCADWILDQALEDHHEGARDFISGAEEAELQAFLDDWAKKRGIVTWHEDRTRAVMLTGSSE